MHRVQQDMDLPPFEGHSQLEIHNLHFTLINVQSVLE